MRSRGAGYGASCCDVGHLICLVAACRALSDDERTPGAQQVLSTFVRTAPTVPSGLAAALTLDASSNPSSFALLLTMGGPAEDQGQELKGHKTTDVWGDTATLHLLRDGTHEPRVPMKSEQLNRPAVTACRGRSCTASAPMTRHTWYQNLGTCRSHQTYPRGNGALAVQAHLRIAPYPLLVERT